MSGLVEWIIHTCPMLQIPSLCHQPTLPPHQGSRSPSTLTSKDPHSKNATNQESASRSKPSSLKPTLAAVRHNKKHTSTSSVSALASGKCFHHKLSVISKSSSTASRHSKTFLGSILLNLRGLIYHVRYNLR